MIKRYELQSFFGQGSMVEDPIGDYVKWEDYKEIKNELLGVVSGLRNEIRGMERELRDMEKAASDAYGEERHRSSW